MNEKELITSLNTLQEVKPSEAFHKRMQLVLTTLPERKGRFSFSFAMRIGLVALVLLLACSGIVVAAQSHTVNPIAAVKKIVQQSQVPFVKQDVHKNDIPKALLTPKPTATTTPTPTGEQKENKNQTGSSGHSFGRITHEVENVFHHMFEKRNYSPSPTTQPTEDETHQDVKGASSFMHDNGNHFDKGNQ